MLLIDAGNTYIKWQLSDQDGLLKSGKVKSVSFGSLFEDGLQDLSGFEVAISSVLDDKKTMLIGSVAKAKGAKSVGVAETKKSFLGLSVAYDNYKMLGVDRWLVMLAAFVRYGGGVCVIDAGSAITADFINKQGGHDGGLILPGLPLLFKSLSISTDKVGAHKVLGSLDYGLGRSTKECVNNGVALMVSGALKEIGMLIHKMDEAHLVLTGGDASMINNSFSSTVKTIVNENLVFEGLCLAMDHGGLKGVL